MLKIGMAQMRVEPGEAEANLTRARAMIRDAGRRGCHAVVLPECLDAGWTFPGARQLAAPIPGPHSEALAAAAREAGVYVAAGLTERDGGRIYNAAVLLSPGGELLLKHRKINELEIARDLYSTGTSLGVAETPMGAVALNICADNFPESLELGQALARMGARLLLSPCAWAVDPDHDNTREPYGDLWRGSYRALTTRYPLLVVGVSNVGPLTAGPWRGRKCIGCSLAMGPGGAILAEGPYGEHAQTLLVVEAEISSGSPASASRS
jgi:predicted amidohydrolase